MFGLDEDGTMRLVYLATLLALIAAVGWRGRNLVGAARHLAIWALILVALVVAYAYRGPLLRFAEPVVRELAPSRVVEVTLPGGANELAVVRGSDGHFHLDAEVNGVTVRFLVDTGATGTTLTARDAGRAGIDIAALDFDRPVQTANGRAFYARARLASLEIGPFRLAEVPVAVMPEAALSTSLLGMSTINRFTRWRIEGERLILSP